jgi:hypothetical protein
MIIRVYLTESVATRHPGPYLVDDIECRVLHASGAVGRIEPMIPQVDYEDADVVEQTAALADELGLTAQEP